MIVSHSSIPSSVDSKKKEEEKMNIFHAKGKVYLEEGGWEAATLSPSHLVPAPELGRGSVAVGGAYFFSSCRQDVL